LKDNPLILAVDRNERNLELLAQFLGKDTTRELLLLIRCLLRN